MGPFLSTPIGDSRIFKSGEFRTSCLTSRIMLRVQDVGGLKGLDTGGTW
jgi:hypothetical protein